MHIENIRSAEEKMAEYVKEYLNKDLCEIDTHELGEMIDMVKDLCDAEYKARISVAMDEADEEESRMGYDRYRHTNGRFARKGTGRRMGYRPYLHMMKWDDEDMYDEYPEITGNYRMGYTAPERNARYEDSNNGYGHSRYGESYDQYRTARKHYSEMHDAEHQQKVRDTIADVFNDMELIATDMVKDMTAEDKTKYKQKLQNMMQKIQ